MSTAAAQPSLSKRSVHSSSLPSEVRTCASPFGGHILLALSFCAEIRSLARKQHGPCIPYVGSYLGDLALADEGNPKMVNNVINFRKYALMASIIDELLRFQLIPCM